MTGWSLTAVCLLSSCSWLQEGEHCVCDVEIDIDKGQVDKITINSEHVKAKDEGELEAP